MEIETIIQRLAFAKYLLQKGNHEAQNSEPLSSVAILHYHDALELTFDLILEDKGISSKNLSFMQYFDKINEWLKTNEKIEISLKPSLEKLKNRRVNLKHKGLFPSKKDIQESEFTANAIFEGLCKNIYDLEVKDISMVSLIENERVRNHISEAIKEYPDDQENSIADISLAFEFLLKDYESSKVSIYNRYPFNFGKNMSKYSMRSSDTFLEFMDDTQEAIELMKKALKILALGLNYKKYMKFRLLIRESYWMYGSEMPRFDLIEGEKINKSDFDFCINYIIECAFKLQEFDFQISGEE